MQDSPTHAADDEHLTVAANLLKEMTLDEKLAQLVGLWITSKDAAVAPMQDQMSSGTAVFDEAAADGLGQMTRVYGTRPVEPLTQLAWLRERQRWLRSETRLGIPALVHEECLTGAMAWHATTFPTPLAWGATFDPDLVEQMGAAIGETLRALSIHQGLAPVLDVIRDARWGRVEECISEDPYVVGSIGTAYVQGMQRSGVVATLKHFVGYSASRAGRNLAPVHAGPREVADVLLIPFEMAVRDGGVDSVMHSYAEIDGVPVAADARLLTEVLREQWGFEGTVVADYFGVAFLQTLHGVAADLGDAAAQALHAGVDVELPTGDAYLEPLRDRILDGTTPESLVDRAVLRVLRQKSRLGLLDPGFDVEVPETLDLDPPAHRSIASRLAEESVILLRNNGGVLPLTDARPTTMAVVGPTADRAGALFGCYSFINHVLPHHPEFAPGLDVPTVLEAMRAEFADTEIVHAAGCDVDSDDRSGIQAATDAVASADVAVIVVGDHAGMFGRGTVGEGCDRDSLDLPGVQRELIEAALSTGTPVILVLLTGRPYAIDWALDRCPAVVQSFFPGEEGAGAIVGVLSGRINPSGRLPVSLPRSAGAQPHSYLHPALDGPTEVSNLDTAPPLPFGHGLSYTRFTHADLHATSGSTDEMIEVTVRVTNAGDRHGADVVQLYAHDPVASVTRPVAQLLGYRRVELAAGESATVRFLVPTTRLAFSDRSMKRVVEPGEVNVWVGSSCAHRETETTLVLTGPVHEVRGTDERLVRTEVHRSEAG